MTTEQKIKKPYMIKLTIWFGIVAALSTAAYLYYKISEPEFEPILTATLLLFIYAVIFWMLGISKYLFDRSFSGEIVSVKTSVRRVWASAVDRKSETRVAVEITVNCDNGKAEYFEELLPSKVTGNIPYAVGDRVYHIKGAKHTCRFPRNDTAKQYAPISVICPICGAINTLGTKDCAFCNTNLPYDPLLK